MQLHTPELEHLLNGNTDYDCLLDQIRRYLAHQLQVQSWC
jgi:hypothetical protein